MAAVLCSAAGGPKSKIKKKWKMSEVVVLGGCAVHMFAEKVIKPKEKRVFENVQIEVPG